MKALALFASKAAKRQDLALIALLLMTVFMLILPLPTELVDLLIGLNLSLVVLVLVVSVYLKTPTAFTTLPAVLLFSTLFRLSISISTTRLILLQADAGRIVETFGDFVVGGSVVVGLVIFLIITVVQFVVITKGAERVAEVSARFSLDALPGRQMSIDSDIRAGEIDMEEAKRRRKLLQLESEFYGSMDGAMKFVKGDAIAGLIIIAINLIGGIAVGVLQNDMSMGEATARYSVLTVGDGLVSQIPALLMAIASGIVITRIANDDESSDLGRDIATQMAGSPRALQIAGIVLLFFGLIPGFPLEVFAFLAVVFGGIGLWTEFRFRREAIEDRNTVVANPRQDLMMTPMSPVHVAVGPELAESMDRTAFQKHALSERTNLFDQLGVPFPPASLNVDNLAPNDRWRLVVENVPVAEGTLPIDMVMVIDEPEIPEILDISLTEFAVNGLSEKTYWAAQSDEAALRKAGVAVQRAEEVLATVVSKILPKHSSDFVGVHETTALLTAMENRYEGLVKEAQKAIPIQKLALVIRRLVEEQVPVRNMRIVLETVIEWSTREKDPDILSEYVRVALSRQISHRYADENRIIAAYVVEVDIEETVRSSIKHSSTGSFLGLDHATSRNLLDKFNTAIGDLSEHATMPVILATMDIRRFLRKFLYDNGVECPVLSHKEISSDYKVHPLAMVTMS